MPSKKKQLLLNKIISCACLLFVSSVCWAQPANDNCANAQPLCSSESSSGTTTAATPQCGGADGDCLSAGTWGQCYDVNNSVWFTFMTNANGGAVNITINNINCISAGSDSLEAVLIEAGTACDPTTYNGLDCSVGEPNTLNLTAGGLTPNTIYWIQVDGGDNPLPIAECDFDITVSGEAVEWIVNVQVTDATCGNDDGQAIVTPMSGTPDWTYQWDAGANNQTDSTATGLGAGTYNCTITDAVGCDTVISVTINEVSTITIDFNGQDASCSANDGSATANPSNGTSPYTYNWSNNGQTQTINNLAAGNYTVTVTDDNGCTQVDSVTINQPDQPLGTATSTGSGCQPTGTITADATGGTPPYTYSLNGSTPQSSNTFGPLGPGSYTVTIFDSESCQFTTVAVIADECDEDEVNASNSFSPNEDGINDTWRISGLGDYPESKITVFDRWGQKVFNQTGYDTPWDGKSLGFPVPAATYYYLIYLDNKDKDAGTLVGFVAIVR